MTDTFIDEDIEEELEYESDFEDSLGSNDEDKTIIHDRYIEHPGEIEEKVEIGTTGENEEVEVVVLDVIEKGDDEEEDILSEVDDGEDGNEGEAEFGDYVYRNSNKGIESLKEFNEDEEYILDSDNERNGINDREYDTNEMKQEKIEELIDKEFEEEFFENEVKRESSEKIQSTPYDKIKKIPIYLDFCDLISKNEEEGFQVYGLEEKINVEFDFMKFFKPECEEDELYSEIDSLFETNDECMNLSFNEIFRRVGQKLGIEELKYVNIHLTFTDLNNLTIESSCKDNDDIKLNELLLSYLKLREQSPNHDLYRFLTVRVWCTNSISKQIQIITDFSNQGRSIENLEGINTIKKRSLTDQQDENNQKRSKNL